MAAERYYRSAVESLSGVDLLERFREEVLKCTRWLPTLLPDAFLNAVDWTELWVISLVIFYAILLLLAVLTRRKNNIQMGLFIFTILGVYFAERLNLILAHNWTSFTQYPYFDHQGVFLSAVFSTPLLCISCIIVVNSMLTLLELTVKWRKAEHKYRATLLACKKE